jgi:hypothetical protein
MHCLTSDSQQREGGHRFSNRQAEKEEEEENEEK